MTENLPLYQQSQLHKMTGSHSLVRSSHFFYVLPIARPRAFGISNCRVRFWPFPPLSPKRTADIDVFVEFWKQIPGQFHDPADFSQPLAFEIFCMSEMRIMPDRFEDWYSRQFHYKMRVARLISKRYNHHGRRLWCLRGWKPNEPADMHGNSGVPSISFGPGLQRAFAEGIMDKGDLVRKIQELGWKVME